VNRHGPGTLPADLREEPEPVVRLAAEPALREVCVTIPEATVPEFERKVNELMLVSLTLAERRKRKPRPRKATTPTLL
jgi:hypothetical protein